MEKKRILVVDDLAIFREPISIALKSHGFNAITAVSGMDALTFIKTQSEPIDLLIIDYLMPAMNGLNFLQQARSMHQVKNAPAIFLTDMEDKDVMNKASTLGVNDYILKSKFTINTLIEKVRVCLSDS